MPDNVLSENWNLLRVKKLSSNAYKNRILLPLVGSVQNFRRALLSREQTSLAQSFNPQRRRQSNTLSFFRVSRFKKVTRNTTHLLRNLKGMFLYSLDDILEEDFRRERVTMINNWLSVFPVPAVQFHTAASFFQCVDVRVYTRRTSQLIV